MTLESLVCLLFQCYLYYRPKSMPITGFLEDSPVLLGFSLLALCVLLFMQKFRDFLYMQSTEIAKQNKQQRPSSHVHNTHTTREERSRQHKEQVHRCYFLFSQVKNSLWPHHVLFDIFCWSSIDDALVLLDD